MKCLFLSFYLLITISFYAQVPIGQWQEHLSYNTGLGVTAINNTLYCATAEALIVVDQTENLTTKLSKVNGLAETGISMLAQNPFTKTLIIGYTNSNIDLIKDKKIINYNDIKRKNIVGDKRVYAAYSINDLTYLCTGFGIVVLNEIRNETADTYFIGNNGTNVAVKSLTAMNGQFIAATSEGIKSAPTNSNTLTNYATWVNWNNIYNVQQVLNFNNQLLAVKTDSIFKWNGVTWNYFYHSTNNIVNVTINEMQLLVSLNNNQAQGAVTILNNAGIVQATLRNGTLPEIPKQAIFSNGAFWVADFYKGLFRVENNSFSTFTPNAPQSAIYGEMAFVNDNLIATAGSVNDSWIYQFNANGAMQFQERNWNPIWKFNTPALDTMLDFVTVAGNNTQLYLGSYGSGLLQLNNNGNASVVYKQGKLQPAFGDPLSYRVAGLALDQDQNLWISNYGAAQPLVVKQTNGTFNAFSPTFTVTENAFAQIVIDNDNQKWIQLPKGNGLACYNHGTNISNFSDDKWAYYRTDKGLPSNEVFCIAKDKDGVIWVGTNRGIGLIQCTGEVFAAGGCPAILPIVQNDQFAGYLFQNEVVQCIAVDGANRKWIGTRNGVWLISSGGQKIIYRFSEDNSPLLNNDVRKIAIDPKTGEVFFATLKGLCSFRSTATEAVTNEDKILVFPNPVRLGFTGLIGMKNLPENAIVKITDLNGRLVHQTKALGGQAVWNGINYQGKKVNSGVYLVLATNEETNEKRTGKIFIIDQK